VAETRLQSLKWTFRSRASKPVSRRSPSVGRFDSCAAPLSQNPLHKAGFGVSGSGLMGEQLLVSDARAGLKYAIRLFFGSAERPSLARGTRPTPREHESSGSSQAGLSRDGLGLGTEASAGVSSAHRSVQIETIPHVTPRDTSVMGSNRSCSALMPKGVRNVLAATGDPPHVADYPGSSGCPNTSVSTTR
jgi:hypothetical protein